VIAGGEPHFALFGGYYGDRCKLKEFSGVILESGTKDSISLKRIGLPTFAFGPCIVGALFGKYAKPIECNTTVVCDGVEINPGDIIVADNDGIVVVPKDVLPKIVEMVEETEKKEEEAIAGLGALFG
jgi:4-hydroxy-4-methyl-2-oxoglutarate aldolase